jgi:predicted transcriptional regulator
MVQVLKLVEYIASESADDVFEVEEGYEVVVDEGNNQKEEGEAFEEEEGEQSGDF